MNIISNKNEHKSTYSSNISVPSKKQIVDITQTVINNQHKHMNIPPGNVNIPSSEFKLPHYKPNEYYPFDNDQIRKKKITLEIYTRNDKESKN